mmetsp:Transcript_19846/g.35286  ORF Transcript_19846/g.35286 Transcript_19846/m.35286 type:complete len:164 (+) Transcript_19846:76-567(+)
MAEEVVKGLSANSVTVNGAGLRIGVVHTRWNDAIISALRKGCLAELEKLGVSDVVEMEVAGAFELPFAAQRMIKKHQVDAVICIGCLIKGETMHFEYISEAASQGIMRVGLDTGVPVIFGVLTCNTDKQALYRAGLTEDGGHNHGPEWGATAVEMALLRKETE